jgi:hypothetical protein
MDTSTPFLKTIEWEMMNKKVSLTHESRFEPNLILLRFLLEIFSTVNVIIVLCAMRSVPIDRYQDSTSSTIQK